MHQGLAINPRAQNPKPYAGSQLTSKHGVITV